MNSTATCNSITSIFFPVIDSNIRNKNTINVSTAKEFLSKLKTWNQISLLGQTDYDYISHTAIIYKVNNKYVVYDSYDNYRLSEARIYTDDEFKNLCEMLWTNNVNSYNQLFNVKLNNIELIKVKVYNIM